MREAGSLSGAHVESALVDSYLIASSERVHSYHAHPGDLRGIIEMVASQLRVIWTMPAHEAGGGGRGISAGACLTVTVGGPCPELLCILDNTEEYLIIEEVGPESHVYKRTRDVKDTDEGPAVVFEYLGQEEATS
jgi:hypothetical protein